MTTNDDTGDWQRLTIEEALALLKEGRRASLILASDVLESFGRRREMTAALEVLHEALGDLDEWAEGIVLVLERDCKASLGEVQEH